MGGGYTTPCYPGPPACPHCPVPLPGLWRAENRGSKKGNSYTLKLSDSICPLSSLQLLATQDMTSRQTVGVAGWTNIAYLECGNAGRSNQTVSIRAFVLH